MRTTEQAPGLPRVTYATLRELNHRVLGGHTFIILQLNITTISLDYERKKVF